jgi:deoxycytidylate deaminase
MPAETFRLSNQEKRFLNIAIKAAGSSDMKKKHGAVVVKSGRVLAIGTNKFRNHPAQTASDRIQDECSVHAEIDAISRCDPRGASLYVARVNNSGDVRYSRPCKRCELKLQQAGIKKVVWSSERDY